MQSDPPGWPGITWIEGRTLLQVPSVEGQGEWRVGPAKRADSPVFHNVAMANNRTNETTNRLKKVSCIYALPYKPVGLKINIKAINT